MEEHQRLLHRLSEGPQRLASMVTRTADEALDYREESDGTSARLLLAHLADLEFNLHWTAYVARILYEANPILASTEKDWRAMEHRYIYQDARVALGTYTMARRHLVTQLRTLSTEAWARQGTHPQRGPQSLQATVEGFIRHDDHHMTRIAALLAAFSQRA